MNFDQQQFEVQQHNCDILIHQLEEMHVILLDCDLVDEASCIKTCIDSLKRVYNNRIISHPDFLRNPRLAQQLKNKPEPIIIDFTGFYQQK